MWVNQAPAVHGARAAALCSSSNGSTATTCRSRKCAKYDPLRECTDQAGHGVQRGVEYGRFHGIVDAMTTTIDASGRLVVPKEIRRQAGIRPNSRLEVRLRDGKIEIEPAPVPVRLERRGRLVVAVAPKGIEALRDEAVQRVRRDLRRSR